LPFKPTNCDTCDAIGRDRTYVDGIERQEFKPTINLLGRLAGAPSVIILTSSHHLFLMPLSLTLLRAFAARNVDLLDKPY
jgi:hypothetical protein